MLIQKLGEGFQTCQNDLAGKQVYLSPGVCQSTALLCLNTWVSLQISLKRHKSSIMFSLYYKATGQSRRVIGSVLLDGKTHIYRLYRCLPIDVFSVSDLRPNLVGRAGQRPKIRRKDHPRLDMNDKQLQPSCPRYSFGAHKLYTVQIQCSCTRLLSHLYPPLFQSYPDTPAAVSYTHLTLPTTSRV